MGAVASPDASFAAFVTTSTAASSGLDQPDATPTHTAGGILRIAGLIRTAAGDVVKYEYAPMIQAASKTLVDEIRAQRELTQAESGELEPHPAEVQSGQLLYALQALFANHPECENRTLALAPDREEFRLCVDATLLTRVLVNLAKNALEAEPAGGRVTVGCRRNGNRAEFCVHNACAMPRDVQLEVFQRSFSSRGTGRGLGTYSVRLLTERYLGGQVTFTSCAEEGTRFAVTLPL
jgi:signal transduction histidine kinase